MLVILTPDEARDHRGVHSLTNLEFENPSPSLF